MAQAGPSSAACAAHAAPHDDVAQVVFDDLNDDVVQIIMGKTHCFGLVCLGLTCRRLYRITREPQWRRRIAQEFQCRKYDSFGKCSFMCHCVAGGPWLDTTSFIWGHVECAKFRTEYQDMPTLARGGHVEHMLELVQRSLPDHNMAPIATPAWKFGILDSGYVGRLQSLGTSDGRMLSHDEMTQVLKAVPLAKAIWLYSSGWMQWTVDAAVRTGQTDMMSGFLAPFLDHYINFGMLLQAAISKGGIAAERLVEWMHRWGWEELIVIAPGWRQTIVETAAAVGLRPLPALPPLPPPQQE